MAGTEPTPRPVEDLLDAVATHLSTPDARARLAVLAARIRGEAVPTPPDLVDSMALAMRGMADAFALLAEHAEELAERAEFMTRKPPRS